MRVAALYDIHGNLPALEAVLSELDAAKPDNIIIGGDVVPGPMPREVLARLRQLDVPTHFIRGNGELAVLDEAVGKPAPVPDHVRPVLQWTARELSAAELELLASWTKGLHFSWTAIGNGGGGAGAGNVRRLRAFFCHATPRDENEIFTRLTPEEYLAPIFADAKAPLVVCGHTHMQFDRTIGKTRVVNAGSVGMPFGRTGADWLMLSDDAGIELRHTDYDLAAAAARIRATNYIQAQEFAEKYVLNPPSEDEMLDLFTRHSIAGAR